MHSLEITGNNENEETNEQTYKTDRQQLTSDGIHLILA